MLFLQSLSNCLILNIFFFPSLLLQGQAAQQDQTHRSDSVSMLINFNALSDPDEKQNSSIRD